MVWLPSKLCEGYSKIRHTVKAICGFFFIMKNSIFLSNQMRHKKALMTPVLWTCFPFPFNHQPERTLFFSPCKDHFKFMKCLFLILNETKTMNGKYNYTVLMIVGAPCDRHDSAGPVFLF